MMEQQQQKNNNSNNKNPVDTHLRTFSHCGLVQFNESLWNDIGRRIFVGLFFGFADRSVDGLERERVRVPSDRTVVKKKKRKQE